MASEKEQNVKVGAAAAVKRPQHMERIGLEPIVIELAGHPYYICPASDDQEYVDVIPVQLVPPKWRNLILMGMTVLIHITIAAALVGCLSISYLSQSLSNDGLHRREVIGYGDYSDVPVDVTNAPVLSATGSEITVTEFLTTLSHPHVTVPVITEESTTVSSSVIADTTQVVNGTSLSSTTIASTFGVVPNATSTYVGTESKYSYPTKTTGRTTSWYFGNTTSSAQYSGTGSGTSYFTVASVSEVTLTVSPIPILTTGATAGVNISGSTTCTHSSLLASVYNTTTSARPTVYQTVTETSTPTENCTLSASKTLSPSQVMSATVSTTAGTAGIFTTTSETLQSSSSVEVFTSTETETVTPVVTLEKTTSVTEATESTSLPLGTITVTLSTFSQPTSTQPIPMTSSLGTCGAKETETETTTVVSYSTVYAGSGLIGTTEASTSSAVSYTYSSQDLSTMTMTSFMSTTSTSTVSLNSTKTISIGFNTTSTYGVEAVGTTSTSTPCTHTLFVTASPNSTIPATQSSSTVTSTTSDDSDFVVSSFITTVVATYSRHSHVVMDLSTQSTSSVPATATFHPFAFNGTDNCTSNSNTSKPESLPLGPASPGGVVPSNFTFSGTGQLHPTPTTFGSSGARYGGDPDGSYDTVYCILMLSTAVAFVLSI